MLKLIRRYRKGIIAGVGYAATIVTALGWQNQPYIAAVLGFLATVGVIAAKNAPAAAHRSAAGTVPPRR